MLKSYSILRVAATLPFFALPAAAGIGRWRVAPTVGTGLHEVHAPLREPILESLLQADSHAHEVTGATLADIAGAEVSVEAKSSNVHKNLLSRHKGKSRGPLSANWFASFDESESDYDTDAVGGRAGIDGSDFGRQLPGWDPQSKKSHVQDVNGAEFFYESRSGGSKEAWQTHYPAMDSGLTSHGATPGQWYKTDDGQWQEQYVDSKKLAAKPGPIPASWFDSRVNQYDGFGRRKEPNVNNPRLLWNWKERSVNATLECPKPGCVANVSVQAPFNPATEIAKNCKLSVFFHPTDYDEYYSGERVEFIEVNNNRVNSACYPMQSGCNTTAGLPLFPCVNSLDVDMILHNANDTGTLHVAAKIPDIVDECPYKKDDKDKGNLLAAVPMVTCMVAPVPSPSPLPPEPKMPVSLDATVPCKFTAPLRCTTRGCNAEENIQVSPRCGRPGNKCKLSLTIYQTDYDEDEGTKEQIEFIKIGGVVVKTDLKPGKNPCKPSWAGKPAPESDLTFLAIKDQDVSENATTGVIKVEGKITDWVDECGYEGYLFNSLVEVDCGNVTFVANVNSTASLNSTESFLQDEVKAKG